MPSRALYTQVSVQCKIKRWGTPLTAAMMAALGWCQCLHTPHSAHMPAPRAPIWKTPLALAQLPACTHPIILLNRLTSAVLHSSEPVPLMSATHTLPLYKAEMNDTTSLRPATQERGYTCKTAQTSKSMMIVWLARLWQMTSSTFASLWFERYTCNHTARPENPHPPPS